MLVFLFVAIVLIQLLGLVLHVLMSPGQLLLQLLDLSSLFRLLHGSVVRYLLHLILVAFVLLLQGSMLDFHGFHVFCFDSKLLLQFSDKSFLVIQLTLLRLLRVQEVDPLVL